MGTREELLAYLERMKRFNEWEEANRREHTPEEALAAIDGLYRLGCTLNHEWLTWNEDPTYEGARYMMSCLTALRA